MKAPAVPAAPSRVLLAWDDVAESWAEALRARLDPARAVADAAMVELVRQVPSGPVLDAGCGEGWLARELAAHRHRVTAFDGAPVMLELALREGEGSADYRLLTFDDAAAGPRRMGGAFGTIVFNFSLLDERITPVLSAAGSVLFPYGRILIQAAHPATVLDGGGGYRDGWRMVEEAAPGAPLPQPVPWYFRTFTTWVLELRRAGLLLVETYEPLDPATGRPVSLILSATIPEKRRPKPEA
jgi:SAM-dependent methyltransferase